MDLIITNNNEKLVRAGVYPLSISDHYLVYAVRKVGIPRGRPRFVESRNFKHFDEVDFKCYLINSPWPCIDDFQDVNHAWTAWSRVFLDVIDRHAPYRTIRVRNKSSPWLNSSIKAKMFKRDWLKKKAAKSDSDDDRTAYRIFRNSVNKDIRLAKKRFYQSQINEASGDQRAT